MCWHGDEVDEGSAEVRFIILLLSFVNRSPEQRLQATPSGSMPAVPLFSKTVSVSNLRELSPFVFFTNFEAHLFVRYCCILLFMEMEVFLFIFFCSY